MKKTSFMYPFFSLYSPPILILGSPFSLKFDFMDLLFRDIWLWELNCFWRWWSIVFVRLIVTQSVFWVIHLTSNLNLIGPFTQIRFLGSWFTIKVDLFLPDFISLDLSSNSNFLQLILPLNLSFCPQCVTLNLILGSLDLSPHLTVDHLIYLHILFFSQLLTLIFCELDLVSNFILGTWCPILTLACLTYLNFDFNWAKNLWICSCALDLTSNLIFRDLIYSPIWFLHAWFNPPPVFGQSV